MSQNTHSQSGACSDIGRVREHNEDSFVVHAPLFAVADGMGGHEAGEVASEVAIETLVENAPAHADKRAFARAVKAANRAVLQSVAEGKGKNGMGTTLTAALIEGTHIVLAQVGDSRAYLLHNETIHRVTRDHSLVADLVERGIISETEARYHPKRSVITRALGSNDDLDPDLYELDAENGDVLLLCSDGLSGMIDDETIRQILTACADPQEAARSLVQAANDAGGHDNITAIVIRICKNETAAPAREAHPVQSSKTRKRFLGVTLWVLGVVFVIALSVCGVYFYAQNSAYLGEHNGHVTLYRGLPGTFAGISLSWIEEESSVRVENLSDSQQEKIYEGWPQDSLDQGLTHLDELEHRFGNSYPQGGSNPTKNGGL